MGSAADLLGLPATAAAVLRSLFASAIAEGVKVTAWGKGSPTRALFRAVGDLGKVVVDAVGAIADQGFLSSSSGEGCTVVAREVYGVTRPGASYATTTLEIDNTAGGQYPYSADKPLILTSTVTKKIYVSQGTGTIIGLTSGQLLAVKAREPGSSSTALPGQIDTWVSSVDGLTISQPNAAIGEDEMSDDNLKAASQARVGFVPTQSTIGAGGAAGAYESVARAGIDGGGGVTREDGTRISVTRVKAIPDGAGGIILYVADEDGPLTGPDLALVESAVLGYAKPIGIPVAVENAAALLIACEMEVWVGASTSAEDDDIKAAVGDALVTYLEAVDIGGYEIDGGVVPLRGGLEDAATDGAKSVAKLRKLVFSSPSDDEPIAANEVPVLDGTPTITIYRVSGS